MKTQHVILYAVLACIMSTAASFGIGADAPTESLYLIPDMSRLSVGVAWEGTDREVDLSGGPTLMADADSVYGYVGFDITPWATIRGGIGETEQDADTGMDSDGDTMWMIGINASLWRHQVAVPNYAAHTLELLASYTLYDHDGSDVEWTENRFSAVIAAEFMARHVVPSPDNVPYSAVFSLGPVVSIIDGDTSMGGDLGESESLGVLVGADLRLHRNLSIGWEGRVFDGDMSHTVAGAFRF